MIKYLVVVLDDSSVSYCHYDNRLESHSVIPLDCLKLALENSLRENMNVQFILPKYDIPEGYKQLIASISHSLIAPISYEGIADVYVADNLQDYLSSKLYMERAYVLRVTKKDFIDNVDNISASLQTISRLNIVLTDVETFSDADYKDYEKALKLFNSYIKSLIVDGIGIQVNISTDRLHLDKMNNCNAGWESVALCPDGKYYPCPGFYYDRKYCLGDTDNGINIPNAQLYKLKYAPICRECDAFHCRRCIWLNEKMTYEVNTPSHEQCVVAHIERNASRQLLTDIRTVGIYLPDKEIKEIDYLDPFELIINK